MSTSDRIFRFHPVLATRLEPSKLPILLEVGRFPNRLANRLAWRMTQPHVASETRLRRTVGGGGQRCMLGHVIVAFMLTSDRRIFNYRERIKAEERRRKGHRGR